MYHYPFVFIVKNKKLWLISFVFKQSELHSLYIVTVVCSRTLTEVALRHSTHWLTCNIWATLARETLCVTVTNSTNTYGTVTSGRKKTVTSKALPTSTSKQKHCRTSEL